MRQSGAYRVPVVRKRYPRKNETCNCHACKQKEVIEWETAATWVIDPLFFAIRKRG